MRRRSTWKDRSRTESSWTTSPGSAKRVRGEERKGGERGKEGWGMGRKDEGG